MPDTPFPIDDYYREVGKNIAAARRAAGLTQADLARAMGLNRVSIAKIETGHQRHLSHTLIQFARVLGVKVDELLPWKDRTGDKSKSRQRNGPTEADWSKFERLLASALAALKRRKRD